MKFEGGRNIAMKVPPEQWEQTVAFYREVLGMEEIEHEPTQPPSVGFRFGANNLWIDRVETVSHAELWLEVNADDLGPAAEHLESQGVTRRDEIEPLGEDFQGFWISNPAAIIHLVSKRPQRDD